jgi:hypothetical protein
MRTGCSGRRNWSSEPKVTHCLDFIPGDSDLDSGNPLPDAYGQQAAFSCGTRQDYVGFEVFTAVTMKNGGYWDVMPRGSCKNRRFGTTCRPHLQK